MKKLILIIPLLALSACSISKSAMYKNPQTGEIVSCKADPDHLKYFGGHAEYNRQIEDCKRIHEAEGYQKISSE